MAAQSASNSASAAETARPAAPPVKVLSVAYRGYALGLLLLIYVLNFVDRSVVNILAEPIAREHIRAGRLVVKRVQRDNPRAPLHYAWRTAAAPDPRKPPQGLALGWWLQQLESAATRRALLERHTGLPTAVD